MSKMNSRPLSPHLQIYRLTMTMMMSIAHRLSGLALYGALPVLVLWLAMLAFNRTAFAQAQDWAAHPLGQVILFIACWTFTHHLFGGLRHFIWDMGRGLGSYGREWLVWGCFFAGLAAAGAIIWGPVYQDIIGVWL